MMEKRRLFLTLTTACLSLMLGLVGCELVARMLAPPWLQQKMAALSAANAGPEGFGSDRDWKVERRNGEFVSFTPRQQFEVSHIEYHNVATIDELGGRRTSIGENSSGPRVVMVGDSFTFGIGVEDMETFASRIAAKFPDHRFINLGVPGTALPEQLEILRKRHDDLNSKIYIFFFFLGNDFADILQLYDAGTKRGMNRLLRTADDHVCHHHWLAHSYATQVVCNALPVAVSATRPWFELPRDPVFYVMDRSMTDYQALAAAALADQLREIARMRASMNLKTLIVAIPDVHQVSEASRKQRAEEYGVPLALLDPLRPNTILENETRRAGLSLWDSTDCIAASVEEPSSLYYQQDNHFRSRGHVALANCVTPHIAKLLSNDEPQKSRARAP